MSILSVIKKPNGKRLSLGDVSTKDWEYFCNFVSNGCGSSNFQSHFLNTYLFGKQKKASCIIHDFKYRCGGNITDFFCANFVMWSKQVEDSFDQRSFLMFMLSFVYLAGVTLLGWRYFRWGRYQTIEEVLKI